MISDIVHIDFLERTEFKEFLTALSSENESVLGYHYPSYLQMLEKTGIGKFHGVILKEAKTEQIFGFLPGFLKSSEIGSVYSSMPFFGPNAGLLISRSRSNYFEALTAALNCLENSFDQTSMISASFYTPFHHEELLSNYHESLPQALRVDKFTSFIKLDELQLSTSLQYDIRKALKSGVEIKAVNDAESAQAIYDIYIQNCIDYLCDDSGIIEVRGKEIQLRLLDKGKVKKDRNFWVAINIGLPIILILLFGFSNHVIRKRKYS